MNHAILILHFFDFIVLLWLLQLERFKKMFKEKDAYKAENKKLKSELNKIMEDMKLLEMKSVSTKNSTPVKDDRSNLMAEIETFKTRYERTLSESQRLDAKLKEQIVKEEKILTELDEAKKVMLEMQQTNDKLKESLSMENHKLKLELSEALDAKDMFENKLEKIRHHFYLLY